MYPSVNAFRLAMFLIPLTLSSYLRNRVAQWVCWFLWLVPGGFWYVGLAFTDTELINVWLCTWLIGIIGLPLWWMYGREALYHERPRVTAAAPFRSGPVSPAWLRTASTRVGHWFAAPVNPSLFPRGKRKS